jgi:protein-L-isoaspartate(D-aspartate) O-methyltransferase
MFRTFLRRRHERSKSAADKLNFAALRAKMVDQQIASRGVRDLRVLQAMRDVEREQFVSNDMQSVAFEDRALTLAHGQTISQPYTVAFMCAAARISSDERVLEIGTGSGYGAAVLAALAREVITIERIPELAASAQTRLQQLGYSNVHVQHGDGVNGIPGELFDVIVVTAAPERVPMALIDQLACSGRLVVPIGERASGQTMWRFTREDKQTNKEALGRFMFVPLISENKSAE